MKSNARNGLDNPLWIALAYFLIILFLLIFILNFLPSNKHITSGQVIALNYIPLHEEGELVYVGDFYYVDNFVVPDMWYITIGLLCEDGRYRTLQIRVTKEEYENIKIGDWYNR